MWLCYTAISNNICVIKKGKKVAKMSCFSGPIKKLVSVIIQIILGVESNGLTCLLSVYHSFLWCPSGHLLSKYQVYVGSSKAKERYQFVFPSNVVQYKIVPKCPAPAVGWGCIVGISFLH